MRTIISARLAGTVLLVAFGFLAAFHVLVLIGVVPSTVVWGGQLSESSGTGRTLEIIALLVTILFAIIIAASMGYIRTGRLRKVMRVGVWLIFVYLVVNTLGNLASAVSLENLLFAPLTLLLSLCALRLAVEHHLGESGRTSPS